MQALERATELECSRCGWLNTGSAPRDGTARCRIDSCWDFTTPRTFLQHLEHPPSQQKIAATMVVVLIAGWLSYALFNRKRGW